MSDDSEHRPWPLPERSWLIAMSWHDLLFMHWPFPPEQVRRLVPRSLELDTWEGRAWIGVVPFRMTGVRLKWTPPLRGAGAFPELNVRTYVTAAGKPGVWFFSLDARSRLAVRGARWLFRLPYFRAAMRSEERDGWIRYRSERIDRRGPAARFAASYRPVGETRAAARGSLEYFLAERYCLYATDARGRLFRSDVHHPPWPLQDAEAAIDENTMVDALGLRLPETAPLLYFARRLDARSWGIRGV